MNSAVSTDIPYSQNIWWGIYFGGSLSRSLGALASADGGGEPAHRRLQPGPARPGDGEEMDKMKEQEQAMAAVQKNVISMRGRDGEIEGEYFCDFQRR